MASRRRPVIDWCKQVKNVFSLRKPRKQRSLRLEQLEDRCCPAVFNPAALTADGATGSLRDAIIIANANGDATNTFILQGGTYELTVANTLGQENAAEEGDLDLTAFGKTYIFRGQGRTSTFIDANQIDRVFQALPGVTVVFEKLTITGGLATDDGDDSAVGTTTAQGGGIHASGATLRLINMDVTLNSAQGASGASGSPGQDGSDAFGAQGGGIYSENGTLEIRGTSEIRGNIAQGGQGGDGGDQTTTFDTSLSTTIDIVGAGGAGGLAQGGGIFLFGGTLTMIAEAAVAENQALGGQGGAGGSGDDSITGGTGGTGGAGQGGGIYAENANVTIDAQPVSDNVAQGGLGGDGGDNGAASGGAGGTGGAGQGGGIVALNGAFSFTNTQVSENQAIGGQGGEGGQGSSSDSGGDGGDGGSGQGGGLFLNVAAPTLKLAVIAGNDAIGGQGGQGGAGGTTGSESLLGGEGGAGGDGQGGGLFVVTSDFTMNLKKSTVSGNVAQGGVGGRGGDGGSNTSDNDSLTGGTGGTGGDGQGGGLFLNEGTVNVKRSTFSVNQALGGEGGRGGDGGIGDDGDSSNSDLDGGDGGNGGNGQGGGLFIEVLGTLNLINSTVSGNIARGGDGGDGGDGGTATDSNGTSITAQTTGVGGDGGTGGNGQGGGLFNDGGDTLNVFNSTIAVNEARRGAGGAGGNGSTSGNPGSDGTGSGGGVFSTGGDFFFSTIIGDNISDDTAPDFDGDLEATRCLVEDTSGTTIVGGGNNVTGLDPLLGALADNGGPTFTHKLLAGSPAINAGSNPLGLTVDQRGPGFPRVKGTRTDIGAFER